VERVDPLSKRVSKKVSVSIEDNTRIVQNIHPLWNNREFDRILSEMIAEDIEWTTVPTGETFRGHKGFRQFMQGWADAFPDGKTEDTTTYAGDEFGVTEFIGRATQDGPLKSPAGEIPPTGRSVEFKRCEVYKFREGKIVNGHTHFESLERVMNPW
jgi:ketosteroid isomerase-like protein